MRIVMHIDASMLWKLAKWLCLVDIKIPKEKACSNISNRIPFSFFAVIGTPLPHLSSSPENLFSKVFTHVDGGATYVDSDTGLESMSSAEATTKACSLCLDGVVASNNMMVPPEANMQIEGLKQEVTRLKCDKLDLLRQNVVSREDSRRDNGLFT